MAEALGRLRAVSRHLSRMGNGKNIKVIERKCPRESRKGLSPLDPAVGGWTSVFLHTLSAA
jgi:hypothetical protein